MKKILLLLTLTVSAHATPIPLWPGLAPGETTAGPEKTVKKKDSVTRISEVTKPTLEVYHPEKSKATGTAVLVCPGGGYNVLAIAHEGTALCKWLSKQGVTAVLLKYRVPRRKGQPKHAAPLQDAQRAMTMIRANAKDWGIDPHQIGVMGFSAGGHLAATLLGNPPRNYPDEKTYQPLSAQPNFGILIYPAYLQKGKSTTELAPELNFTKDSPPIFLAVAKNDPYFPSSQLLKTKLNAMDASLEAHIFPSGGHGFGMGGSRPNAEIKTWPGLCLKWMKQQGFATTPKPTAP
ncbi:alpha/beta hydrolase [Verrucomicrobiaceae bacterium R5-34]|nr:alpha/beta hydrolase [Verrucomicrobiaceae bacterium R5-34]